ncbi:MAG: hypothetical protein GQ582_05545 [Methyloprofundus sp.]|nr:hypothetical protein [Methyloprofundus sp.]
MSEQAIAITSVGMVTGVGLNAPASCAAIRSAIDNVQETRFMDNEGEWLMASEVPLAEPLRGRSKLIKIAALAVAECLADNSGVDSSEIPMFLCLSEQDRAGRVIDDNNQFFLDLQTELELEFHEESRVIAMGHVATAIALKHARELIAELKLPHALIVASDSFLTAASLAHYEKYARLLTSYHSNGFIPGEAGAAILVSPVTQAKQLVCTGLGFAIEKATVDSEEPLRAEGLTSAIKMALEDAKCTEAELDFRVTDLSGEQYYFKEASLAVGRIIRVRKEEFELWHPADCVGDVGAALALVMLIYLAAACENGYSEGNTILAHTANDDGKRAALILSWGLAGVDHGK